MAAIKEGYIYDPVAKKLRKATDEEYVRQEIVIGLSSEYGYSFDDMETEFQINVGRAKKRVDIAIFSEGKEHLQENILLIVECKSAKIGENDKKEGVDLGEMVGAGQDLATPQSGRTALNSPSLGEIDI
mgnify:CR=1 FL=1